MQLRAFVLIGELLAAGACAKASLDDTPGDDGGTTAPDGDNSACPQWDLMTDSKHCGACTKACAVDQVCSMGACKAQCDVPTTKCIGEGGVTCIDLKTDPKHCGGCTTNCPTGDAGGMAPGPNNPEGGGLPYDGGPGWTSGTPSCAMGMCGTTCANGMTACADELCYDTQNHHEHCGGCNTACA